MMFVYFGFVFFLYPLTERRLALLHKAN